MKIAYLMNTYPMTSTTFVRREIEALERGGAEVARYAIRRWSEPLVDPRDQAEIKRTHYVLTGNTAAVLSAVAYDAVTNPGGLARGAIAAIRLARLARGRWIHHVAYFVQAAYVRRKAVRNGISHIHAHFSTNAAAVAMLARLMGGPSYSFTTHGPDEFDEAARSGLDEKLAHASFAIAISHFCKSQLIRYGGASHADKIHIVHCGLELADFQTSQPTAADNHTFVCVGRLCRAKAQALIPGAVSQLVAEFPDLKIILIGDGESRADIEEAIAKHKVERHVELRGWRANDEVRDLLAKSRALLLPSFAEGLPVVIMEALALERPVISTFIAGIPELLDSQCGWIVPASSQDHLVAALRGALLASPDNLATMGRIGRARIEADFDVDREARKLLALIEAAVGGPKTSQGAVATEGNARSHGALDRTANHALERCD